ncbi:ABC-type glycerol-3-phosphate transport system substrate-binding protein [Actinoalloteichus hoggarensis]|uniref:Putative arabinose-binding protein n=1 Tax=Actinoalloteichus hoggarensis TaxID=1470176 RepID=A0A221W7K7_9PSEU|nr:ABC transporter substrate-binding protein [Actinoalloteichus hoggarensis]ASO21683.1 putative arabinose-binding protein precursor [Actinoalloteichus hoggarensis]MBB5922277.1 ABC-type glycerol-3-phosphate transport system substrate-binding protein [Actinoalloteichus hoggarensis]
MPDLDRRTLLRGVAAAGLGLLGAPLLTSCGTPDRTPRTAGPVDIRLWTHDPGYVRTFETAIADPDLVGDSAFDFRLEITNAAPPDIITRMITQAIADGNTPDLVGLVIDQFARVMGSSIAENLFVDLSDVVAPLGEELLKLAPYTVDGRPYSLDADNSITVFYYRQDLFTEHGVPEDAATWEELAEHGERLSRDHEISLGTVATGDNLAVANSFFQFYLQRGGRVFDETGEVRLESPEAVEVLSFMAEGVRSGFLLGLPDPYSSAAAAALKSGRLAAIAMPNWYNAYGLQANVPDQRGRWRMRTLPRFDAGGHLASTLGGTGFTVLKDKAGSGAALDLLSRVFLTREGQLLRYHSGGFLPTLRSLYRDPELVDVRDEYLGGQRVFDVYAPAAEDLPLFHQAPAMQVLTDALGGPVLDAVRGRSSPAAAIEAAMAAYREQVRR